MGLYYQESGDKNASLMVFLHGGGVSSWMWDKQMQYFNHYHCVAVDLPEQGKSIDTEPFSITYSAGKVIDLLENIGTGKKIIVIGFSLGAQVTLAMLSMRPNLIHYAIVNSALVRPNSFIKKMIRPTIKSTYPLVKNKSFSKLQAKTLYIDKEYYETYYQESSRMKPETLIRILEENMSFEIPKGFSNAKSKLLVTVGDKEKAVMKKSAREIISKNPNCTGVIIPNVGHGISLANPHYFNLMVENWVEEGTLPENVIIIE